MQLSRKTIKKRAYRKLLKLYLNPYRWGVILRQLFSNDTANWYAYLGDDVIEGMHQKYTDKTKKKWLSLGYWKEAKNYPDACVQLANKLAEAAELKKGEKVLDVGFGFGEQDIQWVKDYGVTIDGINITPAHVEHAIQRVEEENLQGAIDLRVGSATQLPYTESEYDKVLAIECAFHFNSRNDFFEGVMRVLKPGGKLALTDMIPRSGERKHLFSSWLTRRRSGWPAENLYDFEHYKKLLSLQGFINISCQSIREYVYPGMYYYMLYRLAGIPLKDIQIELSQQDIENCEGVDLWQKSMGVDDYVIITAEKPL